MEEIVAPASEEASLTMIPAETVLDSNTEYDRKAQHTSSMKKLDNRFNNEVHIPIAKQPPTVEEKTMHYTNCSFSIGGKSDSWS